MTNVKTCLTVSLIALVAFSFMGSNSSCFAEEAKTERVFTFIADVARLDLSKYNVTLVFTDISYWPEFNGLPQLTGLYTLKKESSKIDIGFTFIGDSFRDCSLQVYGESPQLSIPKSANDLISAKAFLEDFKVFSADSSLISMQALLNSVDSLSNTTKSSNDVKLEIVTSPSVSSFVLERLSNGGVFPGLRLSFKDGCFMGFVDQRNIYAIAGATVSVSRELAIDFALKRVGDFSYSYDGRLVSNFSIVREYVTAELKSSVRNRPLELYPIWTIMLPLHGVYPGSITHFSVSVWADTGEIERIIPLGADIGTPSDSPNPSPAPSASVLPELIASPSPSQPTPLTSPSIASSISTHPSNSPLPTANVNPVVPLPSQSLLPNETEPTGIAAELALVYVAVTAVVAFMAVLAFLKRKKKSAD